MNKAELEPKPAKTLQPDPPNPAVLPVSSTQKSGGGVKTVGIVLGQIILIAILVGGAVFAVKMLALSKPIAEKVATERVLPLVVTQDVIQEDIALQLPTQGMIEPAKQTNIASEVSGKVIWVSPKFKAGGTFAENEPMVRIDSADYKAALAQAKANVASMQLNLESEKAMADKGKRDWGRLGKAGRPSDLVLRKPHIAKAEADINAAKANVEKAERDLERTEISAPYASKVQRISTQVGSIIGPMGPVAEIYALAPFELRLPVSLDQFPLVAENPSAHLWLDAGGVQLEWNGKVIRREGEVDRASRSVYLVAEVQPKPSDKDIMQPGLFVEAEVQGKSLKNVVRVPLRAFRGKDRIVMVDKENQMRFRQVTVIHQQGEEALVSAGLKEGERICLTDLEVVIEGMEVRVQEPETAPKAASGDEALANTKL